MGAAIVFSTPDSLSGKRAYTLEEYIDTLIDYIKNDSDCEEIRGLYKIANECSDPVKQNLFLELNTRHVCRMLLGGDADLYSIYSNLATEDDIDFPVLLVWSAQYIKCKLFISLCLDKVDKVFEDGLFDLYTHLYPTYKPDAETVELTLDYGHNGTEEVATLCVKLQNFSEWIEDRENYTGAVKNQLVWVSVESDENQLRVSPQKMEIRNINRNLLESFFDGWKDRI